MSYRPLKIKTVILALAATLLSLPVSAASFDCSKATAPDELAICSNPTLSALDSQMGGLWFGYKAMPLLMGVSGIRHDAATAFLKSRAACGSNVSCMAELYNERIATLQSNIDEAVKNHCTN